MRDILEDELLPKGNKFFTSALGKGRFPLCGPTQQEKCPLLRVVAEGVSRGVGGTVLPPSNRPDSAGSVPRGGFQPKPLSPGPEHGPSESRSGTTWASPRQG